MLAGRGVELRAFDPEDCLSVSPTLRPSRAEMSSRTAAQLRQQQQAGRWAGQPGAQPTGANGSSDTPGSGHRQLSETEGRRLV